MEFKGTPGKWVIEKNSHYFEVVQENGALDFNALVFLRSGNLSMKNKANAQIMAHAPEMYQFIKDHFRYLNLDDQDKAVDLLTRATTI